MTPKIRNIIIFSAIAVVFVLIYIFFIRSKGETAPLISSFPTSTEPSTTTAITDSNSSVAQDFLSLLLNVKNIKLNDEILSDAAFASLHDSSIILTPNPSEGGGRPNPFAPLGSDNAVAPLNQPTLPTGPNKPVLPPTPSSSVTPPTTPILPPTPSGSPVTPASPTTPNPNPPAPVAP